MAYSHKRIYMCIIIFILLFIGMAMHFILSGVVVIKPQRPSGVPDSAIWYGGADGGVYIELKERGINTYFCTIYFDYCGDIWYEGFFKYNGNEKILEEETVRKEITSYDGEHIYIGKYGYLTKMPTGIPKF